MPLVLTTNALIACPHGGRGTTIPSSPKWTVNGGYVTADGDTGTLTCTNIPPCVGYTLKSMGLNATTIDGRNAMLVTDFTQSFTGIPLLVQDFHTTSDDSTPAPIPSGQSAPPPSAAMADLVPPIATASPLASMFDTTTPAPIELVFSLTTDHPLQWVLTLLNQSNSLHLDLTNGVPGVVVAPSGGHWSSPSLTISVTLTPPFLETLAPGLTQLWLTGVSQRGRSGHAIAAISYS
jgi:hypothetical protein